MIDLKFYFGIVYVDDVYCLHEWGPHIFFLCFIMILPPRRFFSLSLLSRRIHAEASGSWSSCEFFYDEYRFRNGRKKRVNNHDVIDDGFFGMMNVFIKDSRGVIFFFKREEQRRDKKSSWEKIHLLDAPWTPPPPLLILPFSIFDLLKHFSF